MLGGLEVVVVVEFDLTGAETAIRYPRIDLLFDAAIGIGLEMILDLRKVLDRAVGGARVGKNHRVLSILMLEIVVDPILLHQPGNEGEIGFTILDAVFDLVVVAGGAELEICSVGESGIREHLLDDVLHVFIKKNPAIGTMSQ